MFKKIIAFLLLVLSLTGCSKTTSAQKFVPTKKGPLSGVVVVVDPGHGGRDPGCHWVEQWGKKKVTFYEAAYTYPAAWSLTCLLRQQGALVYLTAHSKIMGQQVKSAQSAMPLPRDAKYAGGKPVAGRLDLEIRTHIAKAVYWQYYGKKKVFFIALHIDSMPHPTLWRGSHVCVDWHVKGKPEVAVVLAQYLKDHGYDRHYKGKPYHVIQRRGLAVLRGNPIAQRMLVEMAAPGNKADSWRLRDRHNRNLYLNQIVRAVNYTVHHDWSHNTH